MFGSGEGETRARGGGEIPLSDCVGAKCYGDEWDGDCWSMGVGLCLW